MLHELLLALEGSTGSILVLKDDRVQLDTSLPFFSPSERCVLNELCTLGTDYHRIRAFISRRRRADAAGSLGSKYLAALCQGLEASTGEYEACLERLEADLLRDADLGLAHVQQAVQRQGALLRSLAALLEDVDRLDSRGCRLLDLLHRHAASSVAASRQQLLVLLQRCNRVLYAQLASWLLYGLLPDAQGEFFIRLREPSPADATDGLVYGKPRQPPAADQPQILEYELNPDMLPSFLPTSLCENILFIGNSIQMCRQRVEGRPGAGGSLGADPRFDIVRGREAEFAEQFDTLASQPVFSVLKLEQLVNSVKTLVAKHLWQVVVVDSDLRHHLATMKTFYLMGRGSLFQELFAECDHMLRLPPKSNLESDLNEAFAVVCGRVGLDEDSALDHLCLGLAPESPAPTEGTGQTTTVRASGWDRLRITFLPPWPLHLFFTADVLATYNNVFSFLLLVKRTQVLLQRLWAAQARRKDWRRGAGDMVSYQLRAHMAFLVNNLQYYLHVDVLESEYSRLTTAVEQATDFEQVRHAHECFLSNISSQCFLQSRPVLRCLRDLLTACQEFCTSMLSAAETGAPSSGADPATRQQHLQIKSQLLFRILSSLKDQRAGSHLSRLLLRIDFNRFVSRNL